MVVRLVAVERVARVLHDPADNLMTGWNYVADMFLQSEL